jgi:DNA polymerase III subunit gamma/tau
LSPLADIVSDVTTALYRRYRPESFAEMIGQDQVTVPLMQALRTGRTGHAYLFSGPRGCGKTTSARILARCLNCEQGPTPTPCDECDSCVALARGGSGSVDVIEIDAASHGGVDDARDLRERASYGPAQSRYKIYIIDEAHMVTPQGFNALLKIVEEPPEHVKFVFATTEPEKVIGTIRSRTHHYPFRLVPPGLLADYMQGLCDQEGVRVEPGVLSFVTRAGGGSVRDSLSVLDQLIAGSSDEGLTYAGAAALLGFTDGELLDAVIDAFAAHDGAAVFRQIDKVIESGHDPRRFIEDLLERLRDLIVVAAVPEGAAQVLRTVPEDQIERMRQQAAIFGAGALSRAADIANTGLTEMTGATAPRLQLELIAARILLPASSGESGYAARLDRLERRLDLSEAAGAGRVGEPPPAGDNAGRVGEPPRASRIETTSSPRSTGSSGVADPSGRPEPISSQRSTGSSGGDATIRPGSASASPGLPPDPASAAATAPGSALAGESGSAYADADHGGRVGESSGASRGETAAPVGEDGWPDDGPGQGPSRADEPPLSEPPADSEPSPPTPVRQPGALDTDAVRRAWPDILDRIFNLKRVTWALLSQHAQVVDYDGERLLLGTSTQGLADTFRRGQHPDVVRQAVLDEIGLSCRVDATVHDGPPPGGGAAPPPGDGPGPPPGGAGGGPGGFSAGQPPAGPSSQPDQGPPRSAPRPPSSSAAAEIGGATPPGGWDADSRDSWSSPAGPPPDWATSAEGPEPSGDASPASPPVADSVAGQGDAQAATPPGPTRSQTPAQSPRQRAEQRVREGAASGRSTAGPVADDTAVDLNDESVEDSGAVGLPVIQSVLGGTVIAEESDS